MNLLASPTEPFDAVCAEWARRPAPPATDAASRGAAPLPGAAGPAPLRLRGGVLALGVLLGLGTAAVLAMA
jgi:hypothetical protein